MNDEETCALTAGGHSVGRAHGNGDAAKLEEPLAIYYTGFRLLIHMSLGLATSGIEGLDTHPDKWDNLF